MKVVEPAFPEVRIRKETEIGLHESTFGVGGRVPSIGRRPMKLSLGGGDVPKQMSIYTQGGHPKAIVCHCYYPVTHGCERKRTLRTQ